MTITDITVNAHMYYIIAALIFSVDFSAFDRVSRSVQDNILYFCIFNYDMFSCTSKVQPLEVYDPR